MPSHGAEIALGHFLELAGDARSAACELVPIEDVVPGLTGVVEHALEVGLAEGNADDFFQRHVGHIGAFDQRVQLGEVGRVVLAVVQLHGLLTDDRRQEGVVVRKGRKLKRGCHCLSLQYLRAE